MNIISKHGILLSFSMLTMLFYACKKNEPTLVPNFNYEIPQVELDGDVHVGAYYFFYDSLSNIDRQKHFSDAEKGGVDYFVMPYTSELSNDNIQKTLDANTSSVKWVLNYSLSQLNATNDSPLTGLKLTKLLDDFNNLATLYITKDNYYKVNGKPLIIINALNLSANTAQSINFGEVVAALKNSLKAQGIEAYVVGEMTTGWIPPQRYANAIKAMDAVTLSNWGTDNYDRSNFFPSFLDLNWKNWTDSLSKWEVDFIPNILPGFDDKLTNVNSKLYVLERSSDFYNDLTNVAKRNMGTSRIVLIHSWNDVSKLTGIEPKAPYGNTYIDITKKQLSQ